MKCQILFSGKNKKYFNMSAENLPRVLNVKKLNVVGVSVMMSLMNVCYL